MIHAAPALAPADLEVLDLISRQRERLRLYTQNNPTEWMGSLRRSTFARAIAGSNSIEGYRATVGDAIAIVDRQQPLEASDETRAALQGYRDALTYVVQTVGDPHFEFSAQLLKSLQFMMLRHELAKHPGQWRPGPIFVVDRATGARVYEGPAPEAVNALVEELVAFLKAADGTPVLVTAAMAHLNLAMIHPFRDGNGRMARALQTLVLARDGVLHPVFSSIEEWLGRHTPDYYRVLAETGRGKWNPTRDALPWLRFCLTAHHQQAATLIRRNEEYAQLYARIEALVKTEKLPERATVSLFDAALGWPLTNPRYRIDAEVGDFTASRDLRKLSEAGLLEPLGEKRGRSYRPSAVLSGLRDAVRLRTPLENPYDLVPSRTRYRLPTAGPAPRR